MKRIIALLTIMAILTLTPAYSFAAGDCILVSMKKIWNQNQEVRLKKKLTLDCTSHTDNSLSDVIPTSVILDASSLYLYKVTAYPGGTAPTTDTDLTITATRTGTNKTIDILGGNGDDIVDDNETREEVGKLIAGGINFFDVIDSDNTYTIDTANNAVSEATFTLEMIFVQ